MWIGSEKNPKGGPVKPAKPGNPADIVSIVHDSRDDGYVWERRLRRDGIVRETRVGPIPPVEPIYVCCWGAA